MFNMRFTLSLSAVALMVLGAGVVSGQNPSTELRTGFPTRPIRIVTSQPGTANDIAARIIAAEIAGPLGQPVIVDSRPGAVIADIGMRATPDGYTIIIAGTTLWITPLLQKTTYDTEKDFLSITTAIAAPNMVVVHPSVPVKSVKELIDFAKAKPGALNYGSGPSGGGAHLGGALFTQMANVNILRVPYADSAPALNATIANETQLMVWSAGPMLPHVKAGRLRGLAVTTLQPTPLVPGLPTVAATGIPGFEVITILAMFAPAKTPTAIVKRLNEEIARALNQPNVKEKFFTTGFETVGDTPEQAAAKIKSEIAKWGKVIKDSGIKVE